MKLSLVIPAFNEALALPQLFVRIEAAVSLFDYEVILVDDGSADASADIVIKATQKNPRIKLLKLQKNCGHQLALRAGLSAAQGDYCITLDADGQHPPESIPLMIDAAKEGHDVVVMVHDGKQMGFLKEFWSRNFYRIFSRLTGVALHRHESDFRLVSRRVLTIINQLPERNVFLRGLLPTLGFSLCRKYYSLGNRFSGTARYTFGASLKLAIEAIFSFSTMPIRMLFSFGFFIAALSFAYGAFNIYCKFFTKINLPGFTDIIASILFLGGLNLIMLSVIAKYLQIVVDHLKKRPEYLIDTQKSSKSLVLGNSPIVGS